MNHDVNILSFFAVDSFFLLTYFIQRNLVGKMHKANKDNEIQMQKKNQIYPGLPSQVTKYISKKCHFLCLWATLTQNEQQE